MPLFVDHVGLNTLVNQELDLESNTLHTGSTRFDLGTVVDKSLESISTTAISFAGFRTATASAPFRPGAYQWPTSSTTQQGFSLSTWVNLNPTNGSTNFRTIASGFVDDGTKAHHPSLHNVGGAGFQGQSFSLNFQSGQLRFHLEKSGSTTGNDYAEWLWNVDMEGDYFNKWNHVYVTFDGTVNGSASTKVAAELYINAVSQSLGSFSHNNFTGNLIQAAQAVTVLDHGITANSSGTNTFYELDGKMQHFIIYNSHSTDNTGAGRITKLYNSGVPQVPPDASQILAYWRLGNEPNLTISPGGLPTLGMTLASVSGSTAILQQTERYITVAEGVRGTYNVPTDDPNTSFVGRVSSSLKLAALNTHRNGPYGFSSWQQVRISENPLSRYQRQNNTMTFVRSPAAVRNISRDGTYRVKDRYSSIYSFTESVVTQKAYPLVWNVGRHFKDEDGNVDMDNPRRFSIMSSYANKQIAFANDEVGRLHKYDPTDEQTEYIAIKDMYLENGLNKLDSPLTHWEFIQYRETIFPKSKQQYTKQARHRPNFTRVFKRNRQDRQEIRTRGSCSFGFPVVGGNTWEHKTSIWPLDPETGFLTNTKTNANQVNQYNFPLDEAGGILSNRHSMYRSSLETLKGDLNGTSQNDSDLAAKEIDLLLAPYPIYSRAQSLHTTNSVSTPYGMAISETGSYWISDPYQGVIAFNGGANWDAGQKRQIRKDDGSYESAPKYPFYETYESYANSIKNYGKNYSLIPEYRMSEQIEDYERTEGGIEIDMFEITGATPDLVNSSKRDFFEIFSNTDFMRNFEIIADDHKDFTNGKVLSLRCKAIKKFLPYKGFYPAQRTVDLASRFYESFQNNIRTMGSSSINPASFNYGKQALMTPLFAPGVLFNTIKSGVAVDYPILTGSIITTGSSHPDPSEVHLLSPNGLHTGSFWHKRIPFEALVEPKKHLANFEIGSNEPHPSGSTGAVATWDGEGDEFYSKMANNFLAESINFFLPNGQLSSLVSKKQKDIKLLSGSVYGMRVAMRRSIDGSIKLQRHWNDTTLYKGPQTTGEIDEVKHTFTMYSRPTAFGPPTYGKQNSQGAEYFRPGDTDTRRYIMQTSGSGFLMDHIQDSTTGFNYPFTPPYYHGEGWCHIWFTASAATMTIEEIQNISKFKYTRFDNTSILSKQAAGAIQSYGPQGVLHIDQNALQLSASLNIAGRGTIRGKGDSGRAGSLVVDSALGEENRWVIQTKFETPMLNFNHITGSDHMKIPMYGGATVARGMWHQYGRIPEKDEGVYLEVGPIPDEWQKVVGVGNTRRNGGYIKDMSEALGFSGESLKLGRLADKKEISEAVVAVPFILEEGRRKFFTLDKEKIDTYKIGLTQENLDEYRKLTNGQPSEQIGRSVLNQIKKMKKYIFPPSFDFMTFDTDKVTPVAMYIFEFKHVLSQTDLQDIWQNLPPDIAESQEVSEVAITHPILKKELLGPGG